MNNRQKELLKHQLKSEKEILSELKELYESSLSEIDEKIKILLSDELTQSKIYRIEYQKALKGQVSAILENLTSNQYESVSDYLKDCYEDGFIGTLYDLHGQGIPLIIAMNQEEIVDAIILDSKISEGLYTKMGNDVGKLKKRISSEISRGISTASPYNEIARNIRSHANITVNQAMRIVRTEGNRIHNRSALDAALKAKSKGADLVKIWDATLDIHTRSHHRQLDGQVRELEEDFEVDGLTACAPLQFGIAAEDCNCRCVLLTKPRWDLDSAFTKWNNEASELMRFENVKDYYDFKQKYWDYIDKSGESGIIKSNISYRTTDSGKTIATRTIAGEYEVKLPDGSISPIKNPIFDKYEVFAGKGSNKELRVRDFLTENYGGNSNEWFHAKGYTDVTDESGTTKKANVHWFEEETVGIHELFVKGWSKK